VSSTLQLQAPWGPAGGVEPVSRGMGRGDEGTWPVVREAGPVVKGAGPEAEACALASL
jgi:hypothetical protein